MTERFDEGDIIAQTAVGVGEDTTARELFDAVSNASAALFAATYPDLVQGVVRGKPQDPALRFYYSKDSIDFKRDSVVDWHEPALKVHRRVRAFTFPPFQLPRTTLVNGGGDRVEVTVGRTRVAAPAGSHGRLDAGRIIALRDGEVQVVAGDGGVIAIAIINGLPADQALQAMGGGSAAAFVAHTAG
jgi:methionyl-tRNA formyltransferase